MPRETEDGVMLLELSLFGDDALTGGGIVGGIVTITGALYVIWDKYQRGEANRAAKREITKAAVEAKRVVTEAAAIKNEEEEIRVGELARKAVSAAYQEALSLTKENHDRDMRSVRAALKSVTNRVTQVEERELTCQKELEALKIQNREQEEEITTLRDQNVTQANEIASLRAEINKLKKQLHDSGALEGSDIESNH